MMAIPRLQYGLSVMRTLKMLLLAIVSSAWLVPMVVAWNRVLAYLNDDLARLHFKTAAPAMSTDTLDINEAVNITESRQLLLLAAVWLGLVIFGWCAHWYRARHEADSLSGAARNRLRSQEQALDRQLQDLNAQINKCRDSLLTEYGNLALVSQQVQQHEQAIAGRDPSFEATYLDARFERLESLLTRHGSMLEQRLHTVEAALRSNGEQIGNQFGDLRDRVTRMQSVNSTNFGELTQPAPLTGVATGPANRLQDLVLNLSHLQEDLRMERRQLRKKLQNLPDSTRAA